MPLQLLVYATHRSNSDADRPCVGVALGEDPSPGWDADPEGFIQLEVDPRRHHPLDSLRALVEEAFTMDAPLRDETRVAVLERDCGRLRLSLAPGFDTPQAVCAPLVSILERLEISGHLRSTETLSGRAL